ncbi:3-ketoacyl-(acyl-carrier-protein) reductase [Fusarium flagelliforme]|uniref:3-ketoacyl-(Acyl-carrier-protein) reductase n=1 Tax=Fusarium flagelliforme TaxID=2675880 RepID=A0A395M6K7_9HYPO|nr:3-ketoacyl-(acyl-carrier-protein) reductase [Fusarium flagelliforme]
MSFSLRGKHAVVTGATGAIGFRIAAAFAERGSVVTLLSRSAPDARLSLEHQLTTYQPDPERKDMGDEFPEKHRFMRLDATKSTMFKGLFGSTVGPVDVLVNCAGVSQTSFIKRTSDEDIRNILDTNLQSAILASKYAKMNAHGCIINVSSLMANKNGAGASVYAASKAGLVAFTRALATEYSPRSIRVNALLPGWIASPMWDHLKPDIQQQYLKDCPLRRVGQPDEVADAAIFLATNRFANNCVLNLDGGLSAT